MGKHSIKKSRRTLSHELEINSLFTAINAPGKVVKFTGLICVDEHFVLGFLDVCGFELFTRERIFFHGISGQKSENQKVKK